MLARRRHVALFKRFEQAGLLFGCQSGAGIADLETDQQQVGAIFDDPAAQQDLALLGEFDGVADEVENDLPQPIAIAMQRRRQVVGIDDQLEILCCCALAHHVGDAEQHAVEREIDVVQREFARFDLGQVENVVDDAKQVLRGIADLVQPRQRLGIADLAAQQVVEADDGIHRRADFMAHIGQKSALGQAGLLGGELGGRQLGSAFADPRFEPGVEFADRLLGLSRLGDVVVGGEQLASPAGRDETTGDPNQTLFAVGAPHQSFARAVSPWLACLLDIALALRRIDPQAERRSGVSMGHRRRVTKTGEPGLVPARTLKAIGL